MGVRSTDPCSSRRASDCASFSSDFSPNPLSARTCVLGERLAEVVDATGRRARRAAGARPSGRGPGSAGARRRSPGASAGAPRASRPCRPSRSSRILAAVLLPMPSIFWSSLAGEPPEVGRLRGDRVRRALVGAHAERLRVALVEHGQLGELAEHVEDVLLRVGHEPAIRWCSLAARGQERGSRGPVHRGPRGPGHEPEQAVLLAGDEAHEARRSCATTSRSRRARSAASATAPSCSSASSTARRAKPSTRSARPRSGRPGSAP